MQTKALTTKEIFCGMPLLRGYFQELDRKIRVYTPENGSCEEVERLKQKRKELLATVKSMDFDDLQIILYVHKAVKFFPSHFLRALKKLVEAQEELKVCMETGELQEGNCGK